MINLDYPSILKYINKYVVKGRTESAAFLIWYLESYYRLDSIDAIDSVCDQNGDKGVDGIYINDLNGTIDIFQTKISQSNSKTIGDTVLKEFAGTLSQFESVEKLQDLIDSGGSAQVVSLVKRLGLITKLGQYKIKGIFLSNIELDANGAAFLNNHQQIEFIGKSKLENTFISPSRDIPSNLRADFDISSINSSTYHVTTDTLAVIAPIRASELVGMPGISNQSIFAYNVRGPLGKTNVNRDIVKSIKDRDAHKKFPLFHNGITIVTDKVTTSEDKLTIENFYVVNGCQSLTALFDNKSSLTDDLRILTKFIQVPVGSDLSKTITEYSNNQNGVKLRDFKSNNPIQVRLQNEFISNYKDQFFFEIKRGEEYGKDLVAISNEAAGIYLMAFDLKEPWSTPRKYQVFDEKHSDIFARPEVTAHRVVMLHLIDEIISEKIDDTNNQLVAKYNLTKFAIMYMLRQIIDSDDIKETLLNEPQKFVYDKSDRFKFVRIISSIVDDIIVDFNGEMDTLGEDFDYRSKLRDETWVKKLSNEIVGSYIKMVKRGRIKSFQEEWL